MTLASPGTDLWIARLVVDAVGWHEYEVVAWVDRFLTWQRNLKLKAAAGQDVSVELLEGALLIRDAATRANHKDRAWLLDRANALNGSTPAAERITVALGDELAAVMRPVPIARTPRRRRRGACGSIASGRGSARGTRCFHARPVPTPAGAAPFARRAPSFRASRISASM
jgi:hypothetical protein